MKYTLLSFLHLFIILLFIDFGLNPVWDFISAKLEITPIDYFGEEKSLSFLISILIIAPLIETSVFQLLIKYLLDFSPLKSTNYMAFYYSCISGILFGLTHIYSIVHIAKTCLGVSFLCFSF